MNKFFHSFGSILIVFNVYSCYASSSQKLESFLADFVWMDSKNCKIPKARAPQKIMIHGIDFNHSLEKKSYRRWIDADGDGVCELYDVAELESSKFTGKIYGFPTRVVKFKKDNWKKFGGGLNAWIPMILFDKERNQRVVVDYVYGNAGYSPSLKSVPATCDDLRQYLAVGAMLYFKFPMTARRDDLTNPDGEWNDIKSAWFYSFYMEKEEILSSDLPSSCKEKYKFIIYALSERLER